MSNRGDGKFRQLRLFGKPGAKSFYLWGVYSTGKRDWVATIETDATTAGYIGSAVAMSMRIPMTIAGAGQ